jgi:hypothetical protein
MPVFPPDKVSNQTLAQIAEYIEALPGEHAHQMQGGTKEALTQRHWMALFALESEGDEHKGK